VTASGRPERSVLVTGATGLVGTELIEQLRAAGGTEVVGVSRSGSATDAAIASWDMSSQSSPRLLRRRWDAIVNTAANTRWTMTPAEASAANVASLRALESLTAADTHLIHVSTAYAVGLRGSVESADPGDYRNAYEWSKAEAERVARERFGRLTIVRPPLIVGRRGDGRAARFGGMYTVIRGVVAGTVPVVVANPSARLDAIPVDDLARLLAGLALEAAAGDGSVVTIAAGAGAPSVEEALTTVISSLNRWRGARGKSPLERPRLVSPESWNRFFLPLARDHLTPRQALVLELLRRFEPYLAIADPIPADRLVADTLPVLETSTRYWAETHPRVAALEPSPWRGAAAPARAGAG
jgi:nucleoside-diphosphate-sugar epimerase